MIPTIPKNREKTNFVLSSKIVEEKYVLDQNCNKYKNRRIKLKI
jgi:hypothetical protein